MKLSFTTTCRLNRRFRKDFDDKEETVVSWIKAEYRFYQDEGYTEAEMDNMRVDIW